MPVLSLKFHRRSACRTAISWALVAALLVSTLLPAYFHLHHADAAAVESSSDHKHVADIHVYADSHDADVHDGGHAVDPAPDITFKKAGAQLPLWALLLTLCIVLPLGGPTFCCSRLALNHRLLRLNRHTIPPLRAPPRN